ncbi:ROK family protein [Planococcus ruber]|uniref:ROK family transcriptional regulator n=1 Tax=Planococcus ruber TaxID=2027871 RepID=UPI003C7C1B83
MENMRTTPKSMKQAISRSIRSVLLGLGSATKAELSETLDISFPTISKFIGHMEKEGEVVEVGLDDSSGGRRAKRYAYNPEYSLGLAVFLEKSATYYAVFNCAGDVKEQGTEASVLVGDSLELLEGVIGACLEKHPKISALSIGVPGAVNNGRVIYIPDYGQLQNIDLKTHLEMRFSMPAAIENDMNAAVLGYHHRQKMSAAESLVYIYLGQNGPGAGIMVNGDVVRGSTSFSGEISLIPQYDQANFWQALQQKSRKDALGRIVASLSAILNPHQVIFSKEDIEQGELKEVAQASSQFIPPEHLPVLVSSDWKQDYLHGLESLGLRLMLN